MKSENFCYWLMGFFELHEGTEEITAEQAKKIKAHLNLVFKHEIDPSMGDEAHQKILDELHNDLPDPERPRPPPPAPQVPEFDPPWHNRDERLRC